MWQFRQPEVLKYEPKPLPGMGDEENVDVSCFNVPQWIVSFQVRRTFRFFGRTLWTGKWRSMQMVAR